ncbi:MFS transporter [Paenibacillus sp. S150]|uniref:MFS transporter n=1 Tax=Paenibacillus sp. S150 TaxID=2749826 RepID=UPI001C55C829|nr:MFS transporter [Paenibacillus sp. S150]MBW4082330.1 MFS transporter [Paenibacillus sp. S150]
MSTRTRRALSFTAIILGFFMALLDTTIVNIALPEMTRQFGGSVSRISWVMNGYNLAFAVSILTASRLADQFGRKKLFIGGVALFTLTSLLAGFAASLGMLILLRVIQGLAGAIIVPVTIPLTTTTFPKEMHGLIIGLWGAVSGVAAASGPALGGILTQKLNWEWIFFVNVPLGVLSIVLTAVFIRESRDNTAGRLIDYGGTLGITGAMFLITYALIKVQDYGWDSLRILMLLGAGLVFLALFILTQWKGREPMLPLSLMRIRTFNGASLTLLVLGAALLNLSLLTSFFLTRMMGMTELKAGLVLSMVAAGSIVSSAISGPLSGKYGSRWFAAGGIIVTAGAIYSLSWLHAGSTVAEVVLRLLVAGAGIGLTMAPVMSSAVRNVPDDKVGISSGVTNMAKALGSVIGVAIIVTVLQHNTDSGLRAAEKHAAEAIQADTVLQPFVKNVLAEAVASTGREGAWMAGGEADGAETAAAVVQAVELAAAKLPPEAQQAFAADSGRQFREARLLLTQAGGEMQEAAVQAFSRTFAFAGLIMIPGILFALLSDKRRKPQEPERVAEAAALER